MYRIRQLLKTNGELLRNNKDLKKIISRVNHIDKLVTYKGYHPLRYVFGVFGVSTVLLYVNREKIGDIVSNKAKNITQETIEDEKVKLKARELLNQVLTSEETKQALYETFQSLFNDPKSQGSLSVFLKDSVNLTMNDLEFKKELTNYSWSVIKGSIWK